MKADENHKSWKVASLVLEPHILIAFQEDTKTVKRNSARFQLIFPKGEGQAWRGKVAVSCCKGFSQNTAAASCGQHSVRLIDSSGSLHTCCLSYPGPPCPTGMSEVSIHESAAGEILYQVQHNQCWRPRLLLLKTRGPYCRLPHTIKYVLYTPPISFPNVFYINLNILQKKRFFFSPSRHINLIETDSPGETASSLKQKLSNV